MLDQVTEESRCGVISCNASGQHQATSAVGANDGAAGFGEDGVGVDVPAAGEGVAAGVSQQVAPAVCLPQLAPKLLIERLFGVVLARAELLDQFLAGGGIRRAGDARIARGE